MAEYKYIIFFVGSITCVPIGILFASQSRKFHDFIFIFLLFGTCMPYGLFNYPTDINFLSREWYRGSTRGIEISYLDLLAIILLVSSVMVRGKEGRKMYWPPSMSILVFFFVWCAMSVAIFSDPKIFGLFELTKLARVILVFLAVVAYVRSPREVNLFVWALVGTIGYEAFICLRDRYFYGVHRVRGTLGHPNSLSAYVLQIVPILVAGFFSRDASKWLKIACIVGYIAGAGCVLLTISRTGFAVLVLVSGMTFVLCTGFKLNARNIGMACLGFLVIGGMVFLSYDTIMSRLGSLDLAGEYLSEDGDRGAYFRRAAPAISDNPLTGVGLNNWSWWITNRYSALAGLNQTNNFTQIVPYVSTTIAPDDSMGQLAPAHNLYLLTVTELGWPGLAVFVVLLLRWSYMNGSALWSNDEGMCTRLRIGIAVSLFGVMLSNWTEWVYRQTENYFLGFVIMGVGAVLYANRARKRAR